MATKGDELISTGRIQNLYKPKNIPNLKEVDNGKCSYKWFWKDR